MTRKFSNPMLVFSQYWYISSEGRRYYAADPHKLYVTCLKECPADTPVDYYEFKVRMEDIMCGEMPDCVSTGGDAPPVKRVTIEQLRDFCLTVLQAAFVWLKGGQLYVTQEEADRRATVCVACDTAHVRHLCKGCNGLLALIQPFLRGKNTAQDGNLGACSICGCLTQALVWCSNELLERLPKHEYPANCWRNS